MFQGSLVALITPFTKNNAIDQESLKQLVAWHIENGTNAIVCCGTTGETPTLSEKEKIIVMETCVKAAKKKIPVIAGTGSYNTAASVLLTKKAKDLGVDGVLVVAPYYNRPMQEGIIAHFQEIAKIDLPIIVYHHPKRTGVFILPTTFAKLATMKNIVAIKDSSGDLEVVSNIQKECYLPILSGDDHLTLSIIKKGGIGAISPLANIIPKTWATFVSSALNKDFISAEKMHRSFQKLYETMMLETNPQCIKYAMYLLKKCEAKMRLPLLEPQERTKKAIKKVLEEISFL